MVVRVALTILSIPPFCFSPIFSVLVPLQIKQLHQSNYLSLSLSVSLSIPLHMYTATMNDPPCEMRGLFREGMLGTLQVLYVAEKLTAQFLPRLMKHFEKENIEFHMFATQWLLTIYTSSFRFDLVARVWDIFLGEGWKICYRVMLALLQDSEPTLLRLRFEDILAYFKELPDNTNGDHIVELALKIPLRRKHIDKYKKEWVMTRQNQ